MPAIQFLQSKSLCRHYILHSQRAVLKNKINKTPFLSLSTKFWHPKKNYKNCELHGSLFYFNKLMMIADQVTFFKSEQSKLMTWYSDIFSKIYWHIQRIWKINRFNMLSKWIKYTFAQKDAKRSIKKKIHTN